MNDVLKKRPLIFLFLMMITLALLLFSCHSPEQEQYEDADEGITLEGMVEETEEEEKTTLFISAAASLTDVLLAIKEQFEELYPINIIYNFGGSGTLAIQIERGAPVDLFISANTMEVDALIDHGLLDKHSKTNIATNKITIIKPKKSKLDVNSLEDLSDEEISQIAIGNPETVPAGYYTQQALQRLNRWKPLKDKFIYSQDVRQVLTYVETGNVEIGFVYVTDALQSKKVETIDFIDTKWHDAITYPAAITTYSAHIAEAKQFLDYLTSPEAQARFLDYGFNNE